MSKTGPTILSLAVAVAILLPIGEDFRGERGDSFPFSWYPMFSRPRPDPEYSYYVAAESPESRFHYVYSWHYVKGDMNQARLQLRRLTQERRTAEETCERAALSISKSDDPTWENVTKVRVALGFFHMQDFFENGNKEPIKERVFARCGVSREDVPSQEAL